MNRSLEMIERFKSAFQYGPSYIEIYENPDLEEVQACGDVVRFIIDIPRKSLYVWDASLAIHQQAATILHLNILTSRDFLFGELRRAGQVYEVRSIRTSPAHKENILGPIMRHDWEWLGK